MATNTKFRFRKLSKLEVVANFHVIVTQKKGSPRLTLRTNDNWKDVVRLAVVTTD